MKIYQEAHHEAANSSAFPVQSNTDGTLKGSKDKERKQKCLQCGICGQKTDSKQEQLNHRELHKTDGVFNCQFCGKQFSEYSTCASHVKTHTGKKPYKCETCGRLFEFRCLLKDHYNLHTGAKPHLCAVCGQTFVLRASLKEHSRKHEPLKYKCSFCEHRAPCKSDVTKHERTHTGERPYICNVCGEGYIQSSHLRDHAKTHLGERPFKCDICERGFAKKGDMQRHRRIHTGELPYLCLVCGKSFRQSAQCSNHVKNHHPDAINKSKAKEAECPTVGSWSPTLNDVWSHDLFNNSPLKDANSSFDLLTVNEQSDLPHRDNCNLFLDNLKESFNFMDTVGSSDLLYNVDSTQFFSNAISSLLS